MCPAMTRWYIDHYPRISTGSSVPFEAKASELIDLVHARQKDSLIIVTVASYAWRAIVFNWMAHLHRLGIDNYGALRSPGAP